MFIFLAAPHGMWDLSSSTRAGACAPVPGVRGLTLDHCGSPSLLRVFDIHLLSWLLPPGIPPFLLFDEKTGGDLRAGTPQRVWPPDRDSGFRAHPGVTRGSGTGVGSSTRRPKNKGWSPLCLGPGSDDSQVVLQAQSRIRFSWVNGPPPS